MNPLPLKCRNNFITPFICGTYVKKNDIHNLTFSIFQIPLLKKVQHILTQTKVNSSTNKDIYSKMRIL